MVLSLTHKYFQVLHLHEYLKHSLVVVAAPGVRTRFDTKAVTSKMELPQEGEGVCLDNVS